MHYWRLLLLAFLAAFQPIASFSERDLVNGRQESWQRYSSRQLYGTLHDSRATPRDRRLVHRIQTREELHNELKTSVLTRTDSKRHFESIERDWNHLARTHTRSIYRGQFSPITEEINRNIIRTREIRDREFREDYANLKLQQPRGRGFAREGNERRHKVDLRAASSPIRNEDDVERTKDVRLDLANRNDRRLASGRYLERRESSLRLSRQFLNNVEERRSLELRENNRVHKRSLSAEFTVSDRLQNYRNRNNDERINAAQRLSQRSQLTDSQLQRLRVSSHPLSDKQNREARFSDRRVTRENLVNERLPAEDSRNYERSVRRVRQITEMSRLTRNQEDYNRNDVRRFQTASRTENESLYGEIRNNGRISETFNDRIVERYSRIVDRANSDNRLVSRRADRQIARNTVERSSRLENRDVREKFAQMHRITLERDERLLGTTLRDTRSEERSFEVTSRLPGRQLNHEDKRYFRIRDNSRNSPLNNRQESERLSDNQREIRDNEKIRSIDNTERLSRPRQQRSSDRRDVRVKRDIGWDELRLTDRQIQNSRAASQTRRTESEQRRSRENTANLANIRAAEIVRETDTRRIRDLNNREYSRQPHDVDFDRSRDLKAFKYTTKNELQGSYSAVDWQTLFYTMQGIYLCGFLLQMLARNESKKTKPRGLSWFLPSKHLIKAD